MLTNRTLPYRRWMGLLVILLCAALTGCGDDSTTELASATDAASDGSDRDMTVSSDMTQGGDDMTQGGDDMTQGGDDMTQGGNDMMTGPTRCMDNEYVVNNACEPCPPGTTNEAGDDASGDDTLCDPVLCAADEYVANNTCLPCENGTTNAAGDDASGDDTTCDAVGRCLDDEYVLNNACVPCPAGTTNMAGDDPSGDDTMCDGGMCASDEYVSSNACVPCPAGTTNEAGDDASGDDTLCDPVICGVDEYVLNNTCTPCAPGTTNMAGNDASGPDTMCASVTCGADEYVLNNTCTPCAPGTTNMAGDDASGPDTMCDASCAPTVRDLTLYATGVDAQGTPITQGAADMHWEVQEDALGFVVPVYDQTNFCSSCGSIWVDHPVGDNMVSRPLAHPNHRQMAAPNRKFTWRQTFDVPMDADLSTVTVSYRVGFDDLSRDSADAGTLTGCDHVVWLNGTPIQMTSAGSNIRTECSATIPMGSGFTHGANTIEFRIQNLATYYGFRFEPVSATYTSTDPCVCELTGPFSTGVDGQGTPIMQGAADMHWEVQEDTLGFVVPVYDQTNFCSSCGSIWVDHPVGDNMVSRPLAHPNHRQMAAPNRKFTWRQTFDVPMDADLSTVTVSYRVGFDDLSRDSADAGTLTGCDHVVWLNGTPIQMTSTGNNIRTECAATIPAGSGFVHGANTIEFRIQNLATYYGFRYEEVSSTCNK